MNDAFASITERIRAFIAQSGGVTAIAPELDDAFNAAALELYQSQLRSVPAYRQFCRRRTASLAVESWHDIPVLPISAFKQADITSLPPTERTHAFYSSGTTSDQRSRHYHNAESLGLYETALMAGFHRHVGSLRLGTRFFSLTPPASIASHSSLVYMLEALCRAFGNTQSSFLGNVDASGSWHIDGDTVLPALAACTREATPVVLAGTAFNFVHLLDHLVAANEQVLLPSESRVMETGGYKGRSRALSRAELYERIHEFLGVPPSNIVSEYGMCELSSQAYNDGTTATRAFRFPPWTQFRVVSPENGQALPEGEPGLLQVFDLANVRSVLAIQTEDIAVSTPCGFELLGRGADAQPRGCSLMSA